MKGMMVAYWHKDGLEVYRSADRKPVICGSGSLDTLAPVRGGPRKKILIVGRELLLHVRKRYPPGPEEKLFKAVELEIGDLFPLSRPAFHSRVFQSFSTYAVVDIWAWESEQYARIKDVFPFNYVVPEDLAFSSAAPEVKIFQYGGMTSMLAHAHGKFLAGATYPDPGVNQEDVERFLHSLEQYGEEIKKIEIYGSLPLVLKDMPEPLPEIARASMIDHPPCLDEIETLDLAKFKIRGDLRLWEKKDIIFRIAVYLILGYALMLYLTLRNYDRTTDEIRQKLAVMEATAAGLDAGQKVEDYSEVIRDVNGRLNATHSPLTVMNMLAGRLPEGSFISRMVLNENKVEISVSSKDPLAIPRALGDAKEIKKVSFKGTPAKDRTTKMYNFVVTIEL